MYLLFAFTFSVKLQVLQVLQVARLDPAQHSNALVGLLKALVRPGQSVGALQWLQSPAGDYRAAFRRPTATRENRKHALCPLVTHACVTLGCRDVSA